MSHTSLLGISRLVAIKAESERVNFLPSRTCSHEGIPTERTRHRQSRSKNLQGLSDIRLVADGSNTFPGRPMAQLLAPLCRLFQGDNANTLFQRTLRLTQKALDSHKSNDVREATRTNVTLEPYGHMLIIKRFITGN